MPETFTVNGVDLTNLAWKIEDASGAAIMPARRGDNILAPRRHGTIRIPRKRYGEGQFILKMWVKGLNPTTGLVPGGSTDIDEFYKNVDSLTRLFAAETLTVVHTRPDATARQFIGHLALDPVAFTREVSSPLFGQFNVAITNPGAFWTDTSDTTQTLTGATGATLTWTSFQAATAPMDELVVTFGPASNPQIVQSSTNVTLAYDAVIATGRKFVIDCAAWNLNGTVDAGGNWSYNYAALRHSNSVRWFELTPNSDGTAPTTVLTHTGGGSVSVTMTGRRKYLTS